jgi:hypothetical protein
MHKIAFIALVFAAAGCAQQLSLIESRVEFRVESRVEQAFGRYLASVQEPNPFTEPGPMEVEIEASLPRLSKQGSMQLVREKGSFEHSQYRVVQFDGDATVKQQVIVRYLNAEQQAGAIPYPTVAITPANYKFKYVASSKTNGAVVYIFQIVPKKKRAGLIQGQIWIDSATGIAVHQAGRFVKQPSIFIRQMQITRDTTLQDGLPYIRVTHVAIDARLVGPAELTITERPLASPNAIAGQ